MCPLERLSGSFRETPAEDIRQRLRDLPQDLRPPYDWAEFRRRERQRPWPARSVKWEHAAAAAGITVLIASMALWGRANHPQVGVESSGAGTASLSASSGVTPHDPTSVGPEAGQHDVAASTGVASASSASSPRESEDTHPADRAAPSEQLNAPFNAVANAQAAAASRAAQAAVASQLAAFARTPMSKRWLEQRPAEPALVRVGSRLAVANLEDRIAWVDDALTDAKLAAVDRAGLQALQQQRARLVSSLAQVRYAETLAAQVP